MHCYIYLPLIEVVKMFSEVDFLDKVNYVGRAHKNDIPKGDILNIWAIRKCYTGVMVPFERCLQKSFPKS